MPIFIFLPDRIDLTLNKKNALSAFSVTCSVKRGYAAYVRNVYLHITFQRYSTLLAEKLWLCTTLYIDVISVDASEFTQRKNENRHRVFFFKKFTNISLKTFPDQNNMKKSLSFWVYFLKWAGSGNFIYLVFSKVAF